MGALLALNLCGIDFSVISVIGESPKTFRLQGYVDRMAPSGWLTSWAIEAVSSPSIETRAAWANSFPCM